MSLKERTAAEELELRRARERLGASGTRVCSMVMENIEERDLEPLWPGVLWIGKPTLVAGDPGLGKSLLTLDIAARITRGGCWPCSCEPQEAGDVAILSAEDDASDVIKPRLRAAGADMSRVLVIGHVEELVPADGHIRRRALQLDKDVEALKRTLAAHPRRIKLLIVDPLGAYMGSADTHNNAETRAVLAQLSELAAELRIAILVISHLNKGDNGNALYKVSGSLAFVAAARAVFLIEKDPQSPGRVYMLAAKSNYGPTTCNYAFSKSEADNGHAFAKWEDEPVRLSADALLGPGPSARLTSVEVGTEEAVAWLHAELIGGARPGKEVKEAARKAGISTRDLQRATKRMRIVQSAEEFGGDWMWSLSTVTRTPPPIN